jgi:2'-5' RNA ligase
MMVSQLKNVHVREFSGGEDNVTFSLGIIERRGGLPYHSEVFLCHFRVHSSALSRERNQYKITIGRDYPMKQYNIALTFDEETSQSIIGYAKKLYKILDSDVLLGTNSNPHITIGQFSVADETAKKVWEKYKAIPKKCPKIDLAGLTILPWSNGGAWIVISVLKSQALLKLHEDLIQTLLPFGVLTNDSGDSYKPHITIAHTATAHEIDKVLVEFKTLRLRSISTELGIGFGTNFINVTFE